jgi:retron-type reverse transcriptase
MRRVNGLFEPICSLENLHLAYRKACRGKRYRAEVAEFSHDLASNLLGLREALLEESWQPSPPRTFWISDPKRRLISAPPFPDRVVHHAIANHLEPVIESGLVSDTYACRKGRGTHAALLRASEYVARFRFVLETHLMRYFPSIDHEVLKALFRRKLKGARLLRLLDRIVDGGGEQPRVAWWFPGDDLFAPAERRRGLPIGNLTSQLFANWMLDPLDHFVKEGLRAPGYVRYMDDLLVFSDSKAYLRSVAVDVSRFLAALRLRLHAAKTKTVPVERGFNFLGFRVYPGRRRLTSRTKARQMRKLRALRHALASGERSGTEVGASIRCMVAHAAWGGGRAFWAGLLRRTPFPARAG